MECRKDGQAPPPKCKSRRTRQFAYRALSELAKDCEMNRKSLLLRLMANHDQTTNFDDWKYEPESKSDTGYAGLKNLGSTCYMNALMQQLYMVPQLRRNILSVSKYKESNLEDNEVFQLQAIMAHLQESEKQYYSALPFCQAFKDYAGQPISVDV